jgi:hypothetical protein
MRYGLNTTWFICNNVKPEGVMCLSGRSVVRNTCGTANCNDLMLCLDYLRIIELTVIPSFHMRHSKLLICFHSPKCVAPSYIFPRSANRTWRHFVLAVKNTYNFPSRHLHIFVTQSSLSRTFRHYQLRYQTRGGSITLQKSPRGCA